MCARISLRRAPADLGDGLDHHLPAVAVHQLGQAPLADLQRRGLGLDVADALLGDAHVGVEDGEDLGVHHAALEELHRRQAQPLLLDLGGLRREAAGHHAADVGPMPRVLQPAEVLAPVVEGQREAHVHQVRAAEVGIVDDVDVAGLGRAGLALADQADQLARRILHGADEHRQAQLALADQRAGRPVVDARRAVVGLGDDGREGRAREGDVHLVADLAERGLDHGQRDGVDGAHAAPPTAMRRLPMASTVATAPGSMTVVASICCTMAGPGEARAERQLHAVEYLRRLPAPVRRTAGARRSRRPAPWRRGLRRRSARRWETRAAGRSPR